MNYELNNLSSEGIIESLRGKLCMSFLNQPRNSQHEQPFFFSQSFAREDFLEVGQQGNNDEGDLFIFFFVLSSFSSRIGRRLRIPQGLSRGLILKALYKFRIDPHFYFLSFYTRPTYPLFLQRNFTDKVFLYVCNAIARMLCVTAPDTFQTLAKYFYTRVYARFRLSRLYIKGHKASHNMQYRN